jgi:ABC-type hemin transport system ATPase subunit
VAAEDPADVYFEFAVIGGSVKVVAIDAATGTEVSVVGPAGAAQSDLQRLALGKLKARLAREAGKPHI